MFKVFKNRYLEFGTTTAGQGRYYFPDINDLRDKFIYAIQTYSGNDIAVTEAGNSVIAQADAIKAYITLYFDGGEFITQPLSTLITLRDTVTATTNHPFSQFPTILAGQKIEWTKSYIQFGNTTGLTTGRWFHFNIAYADQPVK
jgi:hypothetical protein